MREHCHELTANSPKHWWLRAMMLHFVGPMALRFVDYGECFVGIAIVPLAPPFCEIKPGRMALTMGMPA